MDQESPRVMTAPEVFAQANGAKCEGDQICHWCGAPCRRLWIHDDVRNQFSPYQKLTTAIHPGNAWVCAGCWLIRRRSTTVDYLAGGQHDRQFAPDHSWWITPYYAWAIRKADYSTLADILLKPPIRCVLALLDGVPGPNLLHKAPVNDFVTVQADTPIKFYLNNIVHSYTVYELEEACKNGPEGTEPGVQALIRMLGIPPSRQAKPTTAEVTIEKNKGGRPKEASTSHPHMRTIAKSGGG